MILAAGIFFFASGILHAQSQGGNNGSSSTGSVSNTSGDDQPLHTAKVTQVKKTKKGKRAVTKTVPLNERVNYQWNNGQKATPTGNEATPSNGDNYSALAKDSSATKKPR